MASGRKRLDCACSGVHLWRCVAQGADPVRHGEKNSARKRRVGQSSATSAIAGCGCQAITTFLEWAKTIKQQSTVARRQVTLTRCARSAVLLPAYGPFTHYSWRTVGLENIRCRQNSHGRMSPACRSVRSAYTPRGSEGESDWCPDRFVASIWCDALSAAN